ncbi:hypothetical protein FOA52_011427 [Chlamydomonas sp. UWO 241]|nr:hypothetical protein FOA52_011427 [Chlamydomonas sp. UWO 241]
MPPKVSKKIPQAAYYLLPIFGLWTAVNVYLGLSERYGSPSGALAGPRKTKFMIDESKEGGGASRAASSSGSSGGAPEGAKAAR